MFFFSFFEEISYTQRFIQDKIGPENGPFTKIGDLKTDSSEKSAILKRTLLAKIRYLKTDPKVKNYNAIFHTSSAANEFTRKRLKNFTKLHFFHKNKNLFHKNLFFFSQNYK